MTDPRIRVAAYVVRHAPPPPFWSSPTSSCRRQAGLRFACRFVPLPLWQPLADGQDAWLGHIDPAWTTTGEPT